MAATWTDLSNEIKSKIQNMAATGEFAVQSVTGLDGISHNFYSLEDLVRFYNVVNSLAQGEEEKSTKPTYRPLSFRKSGFSR